MTGASPAAPGRGRRLLAQAANGFVLWVLIGAGWGWLAPESAAAGRAWIPPALGLVMLGMGLTLRPADVVGLRRAGRPVLIGLCLQYLVMPLSAVLLARLLGLPKELAVGLVLVGAAPGGTASNVVTYLARGDVALSVAMTTASTVVSPLLTPLWAGVLASAWVPVDPLPLVKTVAQVVLLPVAAGVLIRRWWTPGAWLLEGALPLASMAAIAWIVGVIVGLNHDALGVAPTVLVAVAALNGLGLALGYLGATRAGLDLAARRTVAIEVGMQNSGLAVALAVAHFGPLAAVPGALFSVWHNLTGPLLAGLWRRRPPDAPR